MRESAADIPATRVAMLELADERRLVQEGYELLDEKRVMLAAEILRELRSYVGLYDEARRRDAEARAAFAAAATVHGVDELTVAPASDAGDLRVERSTRRFLGIELSHATVVAGPRQPPPAAPWPGPELRTCASAFRLLVGAQLSLAASAGNLRRLLAEYLRTERRARALEHVVLPEIDSGLRFIAEQLDALDFEEATRVRNAASSSESGLATSPAPG